MKFMRITKRELLIKAFNVCRRPWMQHRRYRKTNRMANMFNVADQKERPRNTPITIMER